MSRFLEDFPPGTRLRSRTLEVTREDMIAFAREFDPQQFHLDEEAAARSLFGGLAASGWHTAAMTMRLFVETVDVAGGIIGMAIDELRWPTAVRPGDRLQVEVEVLEARRSQSKPGQGILRLRNTTTNERGEIVQTFLASAMLPSWS